MIDSILKRRSCRLYINELINETLLLEILVAAQYAPTGMDKKAWQFIIVRDRDLKNKIASLSQQKLTFDAPVFIIPIIDTTISVNPVEDLSIVSTYIMLQTKDCGLDSLWVYVNELDEENLKNLLNIPERFLLINILLIGYCKEVLYFHTQEEFDKSKIHLDFFIDKIK